MVVDQTLLLQMDPVVVLIVCKVGQILKAILL